jgi:hypothetical protein
LRSFSKIFRDDGNDFDDPSAEQVITRSWIIREDAGHRLQVADLAVDDAEECEDGGLVGGDAVEVAHGVSRFLGAPITHVQMYAIDPLASSDPGGHRLISGIRLQG